MKFQLYTVVVLLVLSCSVDNNKQTQSAQIDNDSLTMDASNTLLVNSKTPSPKNKFNGNCLSEDFFKMLNDNSNRAEVLRLIDSVQNTKHFGLSYDVNEERERHMLTRIYDYCQNNEFDRAVFTIGSAHRRSLMSKIEDYQNLYPDLVNWIFYNQ